MIQKIVKKMAWGMGGLVIGGLVGWALFKYQHDIPTNFVSPQLLDELVAPKKQIIGFLPYWLLTKANTDYSTELTTLTYFDLTLNGDGTIQKFIKPGQAEPGWYTLDSGDVNSFLSAARKKHLTLSLLLFAGDTKTIAALMDDPVTHAQNTLGDVIPLMKQYQFTDLNLDIENVPLASDGAQLKFLTYLQTIKQGLTAHQLHSLTVEVTASDAVKHKLIDVRQAAAIADAMVVMAYDYHFIGSEVTGPVAPLSGGGTIYEYDVKTAIDQAEKVIPKNKLIVGIPFYGYQWETLTNTPNTATIPSTGLSASTRSVAQLLQTCSNCLTATDATASEAYVIYPDTQTGTYHQIFYPDTAAIEAKLKLIQTDDLGGAAVWALGYEDPSLLPPLAAYRKTLF